MILDEFPAIFRELQDVAMATADQPRAQIAPTGEKFCSCADDSHAKAPKCHGGVEQKMRPKKCHLNPFYIIYSY